MVAHRLRISSHLIGPGRDQSEARKFKVLFSFYTNIETVKLIISLYLINVFCSEGSELNSVELRRIKKNLVYGRS